MKKLTPIFLCSVLLLSACQNSSQRAHTAEEQKIYILETTRNYAGLVEIYRNRLKATLDDDVTRFKLANLYYLMNDNNSSLYYLKPLLQKELQEGDADAEEHELQQSAIWQNETGQTFAQARYYLLYAQNLVKLGKIEPARQAIDISVGLDPNNGEAYNIRGIIQVRLGQLDVAELSFNQARTLFYDDKKVLNNLAMISILNKNYRKAYAYLSQLYNKGEREPIILHNMLYTIVKLGDFEFARQFCIDNKLSKQPEILINELQRIEPKDTIGYRFLAPNSIDVKTEHADELISSLKPVKPVSQAKPAASSLDNNKPATQAVSATVTNAAKPAAVAVSQSNTIRATRIGEHKNYTRLVIETTTKGSAVVNKISDQEYEIIIPADLNNKLASRLMKQIQNNNRNFVSGSINKDSNGNTVIRIVTKGVVNIKQSYLPPYEKYQHCFVLDFRI